MRKIQYGSVLLDRYRGNILVSATKTDVSIEKDGETYEAGTRNLPVGTYTITATPKGTAELTSLQVNGNPFVSGNTVNVGFGGNLNVVAVSEGGGPSPVTDLSNTKWTYTVRDDLDIGTNILKFNFTVNSIPIKITYYDIDDNFVEYDYLTNYNNIRFDAINTTGSASRLIRVNLMNDSKNYLFNFMQDGQCRYKSKTSGGVQFIPLDTEVTIEFGDVSSHSRMQDAYLLEFFNTYWTLITT